MKRKARISAGRVRKTSGKDAAVTDATPLRPKAASPPVARRDETAIIVSRHADRTRVDPYAWLKDDNWREVMREPTRV